MAGDPSKEHVRIDHKFAHDYLSYDSGVTLQRTSPSLVNQIDSRH